MTKMNWARVQKKRAIRKNGFERLNPSDLARSPADYQPSKRNRVQPHGRNAGKGTSRPNAIKIRAKATAPPPTPPPTRPHRRRVVFIEAPPATTIMTARDKAKLEAELDAERNAGHATLPRQENAARHRPKKQWLAKRSITPQTKTLHRHNKIRSTVTQQLKNRTRTVAVEYKNPNPPRS